MTRVTSARALFLASILATTACAPIERPPVQAPAREMPAAGGDMGPPAPGTQRVILDVEGERARVTQRASSSVGVAAGDDEEQYAIATETTKDVCITPCAVDLRYGVHDLHFESEDGKRSVDHALQVQGSPVVVRAALGETHAPGAVRGLALTSLALGMTAAPVGGLMALVGAVSERSDGSVATDVKQAGLITLGTGAALLTIGVVLAILGRGEHVPGAITEWTLPASGAAPAAAPTGVSF